MVEPAVNVEKKVVGKYIFNFADKLSSDTSGVVYRGYHKDDSSIEVAIKQVPISVSTDEELDYLKTLLEREVYVMEKLSHKNILKLIDISITKNNFYLITEFCNEGDLESRKKDLTIEETLIVIKQITTAMIYANANNIIHRNLKPMNILLHNGVVKIAEFGLARVVDDAQIQRTLTKRIGTLLYMAPQVFTGEKYGKKCDVWSLGVLFYELIFKKLPWLGDNAKDLFKNIKHSPLDLDNDQAVDENVKDLLKKILKKTEEKRLDFEDILNHDVFKKNLPDKLPPKKKL